MPAWGDRFDPTTSLHSAVSARLPAVGCDHPAICGGVIAFVEERSSGGCRPGSSFWAEAPARTRVRSLLLRSAVARAGRLLKARYARLSKQLGISVRRCCFASPRRTATRGACLEVHRLADRRVDAAVWRRR